MLLATAGSWISAVRSQLRVVNGASGYEFEDLSSELVSSEVVNVEVHTMGCFLFKLECGECEARVFRVVCYSKWEKPE